MSEHGIEEKTGVQPFDVVNSEPERFAVDVDRAIREKESVIRQKYASRLETYRKQVQDARARRDAEIGVARRSIARKARQLEHWMNREVSPYLIQDWLGMDNWTAGQALYLLIGYQPPSGVAVKLCEDDEFMFGKRLDGFDLAAKFSELSPHWDYLRVSILQDARRDLKRLVRMWNSADRPDRAPWMFYVEWLATKGYRPDWIDWAHTRGLVPNNDESDGLVTLRQSPTDDTKVDALVRNPGHLMILAIEVQGRFWGANFDATDRSTWSSQEVILAWIRDRMPGISDINAKAVEKVACPVERGLKQP